MSTLRSVDPTDGSVVAEYEAWGAARVRAAITAADRAFRDWRTTSFAERATVVLRAAEVLELRRDELARTMAREMGKTLAEGRAEVDKCAWVCRHYAERAAEYLADVPIESDAAESAIVHRPLGVVLAVMPWNYPLWQVFRFAAPALMAGNVGLLKHASNVQGCAQAIESVFEGAGLPDAAFANLPIGSDGVGAVIDHELVRAVTLTGSEPAGRAVGERAGRNLKHVVLELGGSDPYVILADADLELAVEQCVTSRLLNAGQSCIAAKRWIVVPEVREEFEERALAALRERRMGDPLDERTDLGPQAREDLRDELHAQVARSVDAGARVLLGCETPGRPGAWYPPSLLTDVAPGMAAHDEELFGPVATIVPARDEADAVRLANATSYGLGAAVFTRDLERGRRIAVEELDAGCCFVNAFVRSDPRLPFGGVKDSGVGRELGPLGIREFVNAKTVYVA